MDINYPTSSDIFCVIGDPISHSLSPAIYNTLFKRYGINASYTTSTVKKGEIAEFLKSSARINLCGFNCTMPHKKDILPFLDYVEPSALALQSVNTVKLCKETGKLSGYSTDGKGFALSLLQEGISLKGARVIILGAGGAASSIALECALQGAELMIVARDKCKALELCSLINQFASSKSSAYEFNELIGCCDKCDILVNATSLGMKGCYQFESLDFLNALGKDAVVYDIVYNPLETELLHKAKGLELKTIGGVGMLIWQACAAFEVYFGVMPSSEDVHELQCRVFKC